MHTRIISRIMESITVFYCFCIEFKEALQVFSKDSSNTIITKDDLPHFLRYVI